MNLSDQNFINDPAESDIKYLRILEKDGEIYLSVPYVLNKFAYDTALNNAIYSDLSSLKGSRIAKPEDEDAFLSDNPIEPDSIRAYFEVPIIDAYDGRDRGIEWEIAGKLKNNVLEITKLEAIVWVNGQIQDVVTDFIDSGSMLTFLPISRDDIPRLNESTTETAEKDDSDWTKHRDLDSVIAQQAKEQGIDIDL